MKHDCDRPSRPSRTCCKFATPPKEIVMTDPAPRLLANGLRFLAIDAVEQAIFGHPVCRWAWPTSPRSFGGHVRRNPADPLSSTHARSPSADTIGTDSSPAVTLTLCPMRRGRSLVPAIQPSTVGTDAEVPILPTAGRGACIFHCASLCMVGNPVQMGVRLPHNCVNRNDKSMLSPSST
jgi:hypothetical protein